MKVFPKIKRYSLAAISCGLALAMARRFNAPTSCFFLAAIVSSLYGGKGPGLFTVALSSLAFDYFFLSPRFQFGLDSTSFLEFAPFLVANLLVVGVIEVKRRTEEARRRIAAQVQRTEAYLAEAQKLSGSGSWASSADRLVPTHWSGEMFRIVGLGTASDITEQRESETALQRAFVEVKGSEDRLRLIINTIPTLAWSSHPDGSSAFINQRWLDYTGIPLEEALGWGWKVVIHPDDLHPTTEYWQAVLAGYEDRELEARMRRFDGIYRWFLYRVSPLRDESGRIVQWYGTCIDIEDRKQATESLRQRERDLSMIIETMPGLVWCAAANGEITYVNRRILSYIGTNDEALAQTGWLDFLHPDDVQPTIHAWAHSVKTGESHEIQYRLRGSDGTYRWFHVLGQPARDAEGHRTRWYGLLIDIDDRKNMEEALRNTRARLSRAAQTATVGELAASIAHEINQPLAAVVANGHACLRWLAAEPPNLAKAQEAAERIVRDGKDAGEVIQRIRALFKRTSVEKTALDMNEIIREVLRLIRSEAVRRGVAVETNLAPDLPCVAGDRVQLQQLLFNLLVNGIEAMDGVADQPKRLIICSKQQAGEGVLVEVRDRGPGLAEPDKVFDAFFTTKESGLGMGLTICRSIVEAHHGRLWAASALGTGAAFCFTLPNYSSAAS